MLEHNVTLGPLSLSAGLVAAKNSWSDAPLRVYPGIDASLALGGVWTVYASCNTSLRLPSATELYYSVGGHKADSHLQPEELTAYEGGVRYSYGGLSASASLYHNRYQNLIDWVRTVADGPDAPWRSVNFARINALGVESSLRLDLCRLLPGQRLLRSLAVDYNYITQDMDGTEGLESRYSLEYLRHKLVARLGLDLLPRLSLDVSCRYQDRKGPIPTLAVPHVPTRPTPWPMPGWHGTPGATGSTLRPTISSASPTWTMAMCRSPGSGSLPGRRW